jgi:glyoxylase-like metal-dependent hydrolase (beta-lactamase superfamily II)
LTGLNRLMAQQFSQPKMPVSRVDVELDDGQEVLSGWRVVHLPGHSDGQVGYWVEADRILLAGDVAMRMTGTMTRPFRMVSPDWNAVGQSIRKAADLNPDVLGMGHGQPVVGDAAAKLRELADRIGA